VNEVRDEKRKNTITNKETIKTKDGLLKNTKQNNKIKKKIDEYDEGMRT
jgi:hypothetical protein